MAAQDLQLTPAQVEALGLDHHLVVEANAGSGKTRVLVERYINIFNTRKAARIEDVVAITFTNKAASEMQHRVQRLMQDYAVNDPTSPLHEHYERMGHARISTFHSYCSGLLRRYAGITGKNLRLNEDNTRVLRSLQRNVLSTVVDQWLRDSTKATRLLHVLDEVSVPTFESQVLSLIQSGERFRQFKTYLSGSDDVLKHRLTQNLSALITPVRRSIEHIYSSLEQIGDFSDPEVQECIEQCKYAFSALHNESSTLRERVFPAYELITKLYTNAGTGRKTKAPAWAKTLPDLPRRFELASEIVSSMIDTDTSVNMHIEISRVIGDIANDAISIYDQAKSTRGLVDFDDIMLNTLDMLSSYEEVASSISANLKYLMIDEFQDTNDIQYGIVQHIAPALRRSASSNPNVYIVGDPKQSIYGFRSANVRLFRQAIDDVKAANAMLGNPDKGYVVLRDSFRMNTKLIPYINSICESVFIRATSNDIDYTHLDGGNKHPGDELGSLTILESIFDKGSIDKNVTDEDPFSSIEYEYMSVASWVSERLASSELLVRNGNDTRAARPGDITILVRTQAAIPQIISALRTYGIQSTAFGGRAYFSQPEIVDLRALLSWIAYPEDDVAFATIVKSPLFDGTSAFLLECAAASTKGLWAGACTMPMHSLVQHLHHIRDLSLAEHPDEVMLYVMQHSNWYKAQAADVRSTQIISNVEKLIDLVRKERNKPGWTIADILHAMDEEDNSVEAEASIEATEESVRVMTIHAAKGLEFPIVIVAGLNKLEPSAAVVTSAAGLTYRTPGVRVLPGTGGTIIDTDLDWIHEANKLNISETALQEQARMFYVAITRAQDHIVISRPRSLTKTGESQLHGIADLVFPVLDELPLPTTVVEPRRPDIRSTMHVDPVFADLSRAIHIDNAPERITATALLPSSTSSFTGVERTDGGPIYGVFMHDIMRKVLSVPAGHQADVLESALSEPFVTDELRQRAREEVSLVLSTDFLTSRMNLPKDLESTFVGMIDSTLLEGVFDVIVNLGNYVEIWDWKTNICKSDSDVARHAEHYDTQMMAYSWLVLKSDETIQYVDTHLLFANALKNGLPNWNALRRWNRSDMNSMERTLTTLIQQVR